MKDGGLSIRTTLRRRSDSDVRRIPFKEIARSILGFDYDLSLVLCADSLARRINIESRKKTYSPNVLSFPLGKNTGEIFLNIRKAAREARSIQMLPRFRIAHLFVHGCFHLKGYRHGKILDAAERRVLRRFKLTA